MKKVLLFILLMTLLTLAVGCSGNKSKEYWKHLEYTTKSDETGQSAYYIKYEVPKKGTVKEKVKITKPDVKITFTVQSGSADILIIDKKGNKLIDKKDAESFESAFKIDPQQIRIEIKAENHKGELKLEW